MTENPTHVYWRQSASGQRSSLSVLRSFVKERARVLDLGIGSGSLGRELREPLDDRCLRSDRVAGDHLRARVAFTRRSPGATSGSAARR